MNYWIKIETENSDNIVDSHTFNIDTELRDKYVLQTKTIYKFIGDKK
jgi:hypothetical protein